MRRPVDQGILAKLPAVPIANRVKDKMLTVPEEVKQLVRAWLRSAVKYFECLKLWCYRIQKFKHEYVVQPHMKWAQQTHVRRDDMFAILNRAVRSLRESRWRGLSEGECRVISVSNLMQTSSGLSNKPCECNAVYGPVCLCTCDLMIVTSQTFASRLRHLTVMTSLIRRHSRNSGEYH